MTGKSTGNIGEEIQGNQAVYHHILSSHVHFAAYSSFESSLTQVQIPKYHLGHRVLDFGVLLVLQGCALNHLQKISTHDVGGIARFH